jgi:hypothetical protein
MIGLEVSQARVVARTSRILTEFWQIFYQILLEVWQIFYKFERILADFCQLCQNFGRFLSTLTEFWQIFVKLCQNFGRFLSTLSEFSQIFVNLVRILADF